ncbi:MAG: hypothetical protein HZA78_06575 [Candidatus Schekmanbacteria bacterium]|nr:hypothetical protein [Candidatus Schekmanbacteria bacterium]
MLKLSSWPHIGWLWHRQSKQSEPAENNFILKLFGFFTNSFYSKIREKQYTTLFAQEPDSPESVKKQQDKKAPEAQIGPTNYAKILIICMLITYVITAIIIWNNLKKD